MRIINFIISGSQLIQRGCNCERIISSSKNFYTSQPWQPVYYRNILATRGFITFNLPVERINPYNLNLEKFYSSTPPVSILKPIADLEDENHSTKNNLNIRGNLELLNHLERTSLVDFESEEAVARLEEAIKFSEILFEINTEGVKPMDSVLENESLNLRNDVAIETKREDVLSNASVTEEDYFVAPPGNIPLDSSTATRLQAENTGKKSLQ